MKRKKIVITGSNGFIGTHLVSLLDSREVDIVTFDKARHDVTSPETLKDLLTEANVVVHLLGANRDTNDNLLRVNTLGTVGLLEGIRNYSPEVKLIFASSFQVYWPNSFYGITKRLAEEVIEYFVRTTPMRATILRISNIYGPGGKPFYNSVIATYAHLIAQSKPLTIHGDGQQKRDYIFVGDVVEAIKKAMDNTQSDKLEYVDICSGVGTTLNEIIQTMEKIRGKSIEKQHEPTKAPQEVYRPRNYDKAEQILGWEPNVSLEEGLRKTLNS